MMGGIYVKKITDKIILAMKNKNISFDEEVVEFGLEIILMKIIFAAVTVLIGILMNCFLESIIYAVSFSLLRQYGGGYHADSERKCFVLSVLMLFSGIFIIKISESFDEFLIPAAVITFFSAVYIICAAPIDTSNKRLDADEVRVYGKRAKITVVILVILLTAFLFVKAHSFSVSVMIGIIMESYLMLKGQIKNKKAGNDRV